MSYTRTTWAAGKEGGTLVTADRLNNIEQGIVDNDLTNPLSPASTSMSGTYVPKSQRGTANGVATLGSDAKVPLSQLPSTLSQSATPNLTGLYSARPAASTVQAGTLYFATDVQELYRAVGTLGQAATSWAVYGPGGAEVGYAETTAGLTSSTSLSVYTTVPGLAVTVTFGERPLYISVECIVSHSAGATGEVLVSIMDGQTVIREGHVATSSASTYQTINTGRRISLPAGTVKTYTVATHPTITGTGSVVTGATFPATLRAVTV